MPGDFFGLVECEACKGQGYTLGIFYRFTCSGCHGSGYKLERGGDECGAEVLTAALGRALTLARRELARRPVPGGAAADYQGPSGSRTGD